MISLKIQRFLPMEARTSMISAGQNHSLILNSQGQVFSFGHNGSGQLGLGDYEERSIPTIIDPTKMGKVVMISAGNTHSLFLNAHGQVFGCGYSGFENSTFLRRRSFMRSVGSESCLVHSVALPEPDDHLLIQKESLIQFVGGDSFFVRSPRADNTTSTPTLIEVPGQEEIVAISAGAHHSLLLTSRGWIFSFGDNTFGQLGLGDTYDREIPTLIIEPGLGKLIAMAAGDHHSLLLNNQGQVFAFGLNDFGQLGLGDKRDRHTPYIIEEEVGRVVAISARMNHSLLLNDQGQIFSFGSNDFGLLGLGDEIDRNTPTLIEEFIPSIEFDNEIGSIVAISAGEQHCFFLDSLGQVFTTGRNNYGQLGLPDGEDSHYPISIDIFQPELRTIKSVSAGGDHSLILDSYDQVLSFGENSFGQLGQGDEEEREVPTLIEYPAI